MNKIYQVLTSFEGHAAGSLLVTEPTQRLEALVANRYLADITQPVVEMAQGVLADEAEKTASPRRVRKE